MEISVIRNLHQFDELKTSWESVASEDPHATICMAWPWLRGWFEVTPYPWLILAYRPSNELSQVAFLALSVDDAAPKYRVDHICELRMGGSPGANYTGFVCLPKYEAEAIEAFAIYVQNELRWDRFRLDEVLDPRLNPFLEHFSHTRFDIEQVRGSPCPYFLLPNTWSDYLQNYLSVGFRKELEYKTRRIQRDTLCRLTNLEADNLETQLEGLLMLWQMRWGAKRESHITRHRTIFRRCFEDNCLYLTLLWHQDTPIAARAALLDWKKKIYYGYMSGWDQTFAKLSPGKVMFGDSIRYAIEKGFRLYDFGKGGADYKFSFGALERFSENVVITRKGLRVPLANMIGRLRGIINQ